MRKKHAIISMIFCIMLVITATADVEAKLLHNSPVLGHKNPENRYPAMAAKPVELRVEVSTGVPGTDSC